MHIDYTRLKDTYEYRNINTDNIVDQLGNVELKYMKQAYIADVVLVKRFYVIHEAWAKNEKVHIQNLSPDLQWVIAGSYS